MNKDCLVYILVTFSSVMPNVSAYEVNTHKKISGYVVDYIWKNKSDSVLSDINLNDSSKFNGISLQNYVVDGANFEDDGARALNYFYDPYHDVGLGGLPSGYPSPDWALEDKENLSEQEFSLYHANAYFYEALIEDKSETRENKFGKLFETLGHVIHHVQDMAQPQHVRNDAHCGEKFCKFFEGFGIFNPSLYEEVSDKYRDELPFSGYKNVDFSNARAFWHNDSWTGMADYTHKNFISIGTNFIANQDGTYSTYPDYPEPQPYPDIFNESLVFIEIGEVLPDWNLSGIMAFMPSIVTDNRTGEYSINEYASTLSIFDQDLELNNACVKYTREVARLNNDNKTYTFETCRLFTYNSINVRNAHPYLIPRAVAYSAGLINYFFRGRLVVTQNEQTTDTSGQPVLAVTVKNISAQNFELKDGKLEIYYDAIVEGHPARKPATFADGSDGNITALVNGAETTLKILLPTDVDTSKENPFVVVYTGIIGEETGVAGRVFSTEGETALLKVYSTNSYGDLLLKRSVDYGKTWQEINDPLFKNAQVFDSKIKPSGLGKGLITIRNSSGLTALRTSDNGHTWESWLDQVAGEYTELLNVINSVHVGDGELVSFSNTFYSIYTSPGNKKFYYYQVQLDMSDDDGKTWRPISLPFDLKGVALHLVYLGQSRFYLLTQEYEASCECLAGRLYISNDMGETFELAPFTQQDLLWKPLSAPYRDAYNFETGNIVTITDQGSLQQASYYFAVSDDGGMTVTATDSAAKHAQWPQAEPVYIRPLGPGKYVAYVFDPWTAYTNGAENFYEGILISSDNGQTWQEVSHGLSSTYGEPSFEMMGVTTSDTNAIKYIH